MALVAISPPAPRVYTVQNSAGRRFSSFVQDRSLVMIFRSADAAHALAKSLEGFYLDTGQWPRLEFGSDEPFLYGSIDGNKTHLVTVEEESLETLTEICKKDFQDILLVNEIDMDDMLRLHGSMMTAKYTTHMAAAYLEAKFTLS